MSKRLSERRKEASGERNLRGGGEVPQWAGESDRAKERNAEYVEKEREREKAEYVCILTAGVL